MAPINAFPFLGMRSLVLHFGCSHSPADVSHDPIFVRPLEVGVPREAGLIETSLVGCHRSWSLSDVHLRTFSIRRFYGRVSVRIGLESWEVMRSHGDREEVVCSRRFEFWLCCN